MRNRIAWNNRKLKKRKVCEYMADSNVNKVTIGCVRVWKGREIELCIIIKRCSTSLTLFETRRRLNDVSYYNFTVQFVNNTMLLIVIIS